MLNTSSYYLMTPKIMETSVYCKDNYPVNSYKTFEAIPNNILVKMCRNFINIIINQLDIDNNYLNILFAGSGYGRIEIPFLKFIEKTLPEIKIKATFIDYSNSMIEELKIELQNANLKCEELILEKNILEMPLTKSYDLIFSLFSFHLFGENKESLIFIDSLLKKGGLVILSEEIGDFNFLENNVHEIKACTEYSKFWKFYHEYIDNKDIYTCDLNFLKIQKMFNIVRSSDFEWTLNNLSYNDISNFITGTNKIYDFFDYSKSNEEILAEWLFKNNYSKDRYINRREGHKFYFLKHN